MAFVLVLYVSILNGYLCICFAGKSLIDLKYVEKFCNLGLKLLLSSWTELGCGNLVLYLRRAVKSKTHNRLFHAGT